MQNRVEVEQLVAALARAPPGRRGDRAAHVLDPRAELRGRGHALLRAAAWCRRCSATTRCCSSCTRRTACARSRRALLDGRPGIVQRGRARRAAALDAAPHRGQAPRADSAAAPLPARQLPVAGARPATRRRGSTTTCATCGSPTASGAGRPSASPSTRPSRPGCRSSRRAACGATARAAGVARRRRAERARGRALARPSTGFAASSASGSRKRRAAASERVSGADLFELFDRLRRTANSFGMQERSGRGRRVRPRPRGRRARPHARRVALRSLVARRGPRARAPSAGRARAPRREPLGAPALRRPRARPPDRARPRGAARASWSPTGS